MLHQKVNSEKADLNSKEREFHSAGTTNEKALSLATISLSFLQAGKNNRAPSDDLQE